VPYFHVVFTVPTVIGVIAFQNQTVIYDILFRAASETLRTIAADPERFKSFRGNDLRVFAARSRRGSSVGRTRGWWVW